MRVLRTHFPTLAIASFALLAGSHAVIGAQPPAGGAKPEQAKPAEGAPQPDPFGADLIVAIRENENDRVEQLLKQGANTEYRNWLGLTPLAWAAVRGNETACRLLLKYKADANAQTPFGGALEAAEWYGDPKIIQLLLQHGAKPTKTRGDQTTAIMTAASAGHLEILKMLLAKAPEVHARDITGMTALMHASRRGQREAAQLLIQAGAKTQEVDSYGRTPLMYAAMNGHPSVVKLLLAYPSAINAADKKGDTALILAAKYSGNAEVAALLVQAGANPAAKDAKNRTAGEIATARGYTVFANTLQTGAVRVAGFTEEPIATRARKAAAVSLGLVEKATKNFSEQVGCVSCHHQGAGLMATGTAKAYGFAIDVALQQSELKRVVKEPEDHLEDLRKLVPHPEMYKHFPTVDMDEIVPAFGFTFAGLLEHGVHRTEAIESIATMLARQQKADGSWQFGFKREPMQADYFTTTAYAIRVIKNYMPESLAKERDERIARGVKWLLSKPAVTNEDRTFLLLGLKWAGAPESEIAKAVAQIRETQRPDGGWAQFTTDVAEPGFERSDAYATGQALYALYVGGGMKPTDPVYQQGVEYLLRTQDDNGAWFVNKRAVPANNYLDAGFPYGQSQYISYTATSWSAMALMFASEE
ncbi:MAG: hypothetical protein OHK0029_34640 [Armatimonadaceae bacterium]